MQGVCAFSKDTLFHALSRKRVLKLSNFQILLPFLIFYFSDIKFQTFEILNTNVFRLTEFIKKTINWMFTSLLLITPTFIFLPTIAIAEEKSQWNMPIGVTEISKEVHSLHMIIFGICVVIAAIVFGIMIWSLIKYRHSQNKEAATFHESTLVELIWTAIPIIILIVMAVPATATLRKMYDPSEADIDILITGYQWRWRYEHIGEGISYFSNFATSEDEIRNVSAKSEDYLLEVDEPLVVPINKKIRFLLTSNDVIHSWWVPELAVKKDAIPGFINESWTKIPTPGTYRGQCTELCGKDHAFMPVVIKAVSEEDYQAFINSKKSDLQQQQANSEKTWSLAELKGQGEAVYNTYCVGCHQANGQGMPPVFPALANSTLTTLPEGRNKHIETILYGRAGTAMPAFKDILSAADVAAVVTHTRNAWGNNTNDAIQPSEITALLAGKITAAKE